MYKTKITNTHLPVCTTGSGTLCQEFPYFCLYSQYLEHRDLIHSRWRWRRSLASWLWMACWDGEEACEHFLWPPSMCWTWPWEVSLGSDQQVSNTTGHVIYPLHLIKSLKTESVTKVLERSLDVVFEIFFGDFAKEKLNETRIERNTVVFTLRNWEP